MNFNKSVLIVLLVIVALMISQSEAKRNKTGKKHKNSTKWKEHKKKLNLTILYEDKDEKA